MHGDWKALFAACEENHYSTVRYYIQEGVDINFQHPEYFTTPLIEATRKGHIEIVKLLLKFGANVTIKSHFDGLNALEVAELTNNDQIASLLKEAKTKNPS